MRRLLLGATLGVALLWLAPAALAGEWVDGDGYRFRLPTGFAPVDQAQVDRGMLKASMSFDGMRGVKGLELEARAFGRDIGSKTEAAIFLLRMTVDGDVPDPVRAALEPHALEQAFTRSFEQQAEQAGLGGVAVEHVRTIALGAGREAVEMVLSSTDPLQGDQVVRMAIADHGADVYFLVLAGHASSREDDDGAWTTFTTSVRLSDRGGFLAVVVRYWPFLAGGLLLGLGLLLLRRAGSEDRLAPRYASREVGGGFSRAADGLPTYDEAAPPPPGVQEFGGRRVVTSRTVIAPESLDDVPTPPRAPAPAPGSPWAPVVQPILAERPEDPAAPEPVAVPEPPASDEPLHPWGGMVDHEHLTTRTVHTVKPHPAGEFPEEELGDALDRTLPTDVARRAPREAEAETQESGRPGLKIQRNADYASS